MDHIGVEDSLEGLEVEPFAPCMSCSSYGRSRGESPADAHPMHHLERGLVGNPLAELGSQTYDNLGAKAVVSGAREDLCERSARSSDLAGLFGEGPSRYALGLGLSVSAPSQQQSFRHHSTGPWT